MLVELLHDFHSIKKFILGLTEDMNKNITGGHCDAQNLIPMLTHCYMNRPHMQVHTETKQHKKHVQVHTETKQHKKNVWHNIDADTIKLGCVKGQLRHKFLRH